MIKVDTSKWKEFCIDRLFVIDVGGDIAKVSENLIPSDKQNDRVYVVSNTSVNNGIVEEFEGFKTNNKNAITLATRGNDWKAFYHKDYYILPVVRTILLTPINFVLNENIAFFLSTIFYQASYKYGYGRFLSGKRLKKETIKLPAKQNSKGEYEPDWQFMEDYIKGIAHKVDFSNVITNFNYKRQRNKIDTSKWREFNYANIFTQIKRGVRLIEKDRIYGQIPYYSASENNNALTDYIKNPLFIEKDALIYTTFGDCFYVEGEFLQQAMKSVCLNIQG